MRYEDLTLRVRPRNPWEAMDLGVAMTQCWWRELYLAWFALTLPIFILLNLLLQAHPGWAIFIFWWLKPLYDRLLLLVYSRALFGQSNRLTELFKALPHALRSSGLLLHLSLYRLDPARALRLPVWQLEGLSAKDRAARYRVLASRPGGHAVWLWLLGAHLEMLLQLSAFSLLWLLTPDLVLEASMGTFFETLMAGDWPYWVDLSLNIVYLLAVSAVEPLFVAGGFALYLSRRTELEGWDLDIAFRRLAQRLTAAAAGPLTLLLGAWLLLGPPAVAPALAADAAAAEAPLNSQRLAPGESARVIAEVLAGEDFGSERETLSWSLRFNNSEDEGQGWEWNPGLLAEMLELALWIAFGIGLGYLLVRVLQYRDRQRRRPKARAPVATTVSGLDIRPESLPADLAAEARRLWQQGREREALSLAYRGALSTLVHQYQALIGESATEAEVLQQARVHLQPAAFAQLQTLTDLWLVQAYAHRRADEAAVMLLLDHWEQHFGRVETATEELPA